MQDRILRFLPDRSIGRLFLRTSNKEEWSEYVRAIGEVVVPASKECRLLIDPCSEFDPSIFSSLAPDALASFGWFSTSKVTDEAIAHIRHLTGLKGLAIWETSISDATLANLREMVNLQWLDIGDTKVSDEGLGYLERMFSLRELALLNDRVGDRGLNHIVKLTKLRRLDLMNTLVSDAGVETLSQMSFLRSLRIIDTRITVAGYKQLKESLPACQIRYYYPHHV